MKKEKKKFKAIIMSYVLAFVCITSWVALGVVLALTSANISVNGKISFTANDVYADVTGTVTGTATTNTLDDIHLTADTTSFTTPSSWSNIAFDFANGQTNIVFTINVTNNSTERVLVLDFINNITMTNVAISKDSMEPVAIGGQLSSLIIGPSETKSSQFKLWVKDNNLSASGKFDLGLCLTSQPLSYTYLSYTFDDSAKTATLTGTDSSYVTGDFVIPSSVSRKGEEYSVTSISMLVFSGRLLTSITIPASVTSIRRNAFYNCSSLTSVTFENTTGWKAGDTTLSSSDLSDKSKAATFLTNTYIESDWTRS